MNENLNTIKNNKLIKFDYSYEFLFTEELINYESPVSKYYFEMSDFSININMSFKWCLWGYFFMTNLSYNLENYVKTFSIDFKESINKNHVWEFNPHQLFIDNYILKDFESFKNIIETSYKNELYSENAPIKFKLKINCYEFILIQNNLFPNILPLEQK